MGDTEIDGGDTFEIEKHVHAINMGEASDCVIKIRWFVDCFSKVVRKTKVDVAKEYRKLIHFMKRMVLKIGSYGPIAYAGEEAVFKMMVYPTCTAWGRCLHRKKTGKSKDLQQIEERCVKVEKSVEDHKIPLKEMIQLADPMEEKTEEKWKHVKNFIKCFWAHTSKAHEESAAAARILRFLEVDEATNLTLINAAT